MTPALRAWVLAACLIVTLAVNGRDRAIPHPQPPAPLDYTTLYDAVFEFGSIGIAPGEDRMLHLYVWQCCVWARQIKADVRFSMDPNERATLDPDTGFLKIAPDMAAGTTFRVYADIEHGRRLLSADVYVDSRATNPLLGSWQQTLEIPCDGGPPRVPSAAISELAFSESRKFTVTWFPFEVYKDYWGFYALDRPKGHLTMGIRYGNYVPQVFSGDGMYSVSETDGVRTLTLRGLNLGRAQTDTSHEPVCGGVFTENQ